MSTKFSEFYNDDNNVSLPERAKIEEELDLILYKKAMQEYKANPQTFSFEEVKKMLIQD